MKVPDAPSGGRRLAAQIVMGLAVTLILLAMHQTFSGVWESASVEPVSLSHISAPVLDLTHESIPHLDPSTGAPSPGGISSECAIAMMCAATLIGLGALILLRRRDNRAVLWSAPRSMGLALGISLQSFQALTPLQRTSVLRC